MFSSPRNRIATRPLHLWLYRSLYGLYRRTVNRDGEAGRTYDYLPGLTAAVACLRLRCRSLPEVIVLTPDRMAAPAGVDRIVRIDPRPFQSIRRVIFEFGTAVYFKLALFALEDYDRVVYFDIDALIADDVSELWDPNRYSDCALYAVREQEKYGGRRPMIGHLNSGVMVINRPLLDGGAYQRALAVARAGQSLDCGDQGVINRLVADPESGFRAGELDPMFNVMVNDITPRSGILNRIRPKVLHFTGNHKPWTPISAARSVPLAGVMRSAWQDVVNGEPPVWG